MEYDRIKVIQEWPVFTSVHDIQVFLKFAGFYRRFIKNYSKVTIFLTDLLKKNKGAFRFNICVLKAFTKLKLLFIRAFILRYFDSKLPFRVETNTSLFTIGAILF